MANFTPFSSSSTSTPPSFSHISAPSSSGPFDDDSSEDSCSICLESFGVHDPSTVCCDLSLFFWFLHLGFSKSCELQWVSECSWSYLLTCNVLKFLFLPCIVYNFDLCFCWLLYFFFVKNLEVSVVLGFFFCSFLVVWVLLF